jgi:acyl carrier protein
MDKEMETKIKEIIKSSSDVVGLIDDLGLEDSLTKLGLNSLNYVRIITKLEEEYGVEFDPDDLDFENFKTIKLLMDYIEKKRSH